MKRTAILIAALLAFTATSAHAAFPGSNGAIVYGWDSSDGGTYELGLWTTDPRDGSRAPLLGCQGPDDADIPIPCATLEYADPAISPDGRSVVFDAGARLGIVNFDGTELRLLPAHSADDGDPAFSPDGSRLVFTAGRRFARERALWISDRSGSHARRLPVAGRAPAWSSHNWIAFERRKQVYRVRPSGRGLRRVARGLRPTWSPDGRRLAYITTLRPAKPWASNVVVMLANADGTNAHVVMRGDAEDVGWSPDGLRLVVVTDYEGLLVLGLHGRMLQRFYGGNESHADQELATHGIDWQPLPRR